MQTPLAAGAAGRPPARREVWRRASSWSRARRGLVGVGLATVLAGSLGTAPGDRAGAAVDIPGGYSSWASLFAFQKNMNKEAELLQAVPGQNDASGFAGAVAAPDEHVLRVYWHGAPSPALRAVLAKSGVPVELRSAPYTLAQVQDAADQVTARLTQQPGTAVTSVATRPDGTGLDVTFDGARSDAQRAPVSCEGRCARARPGGRFARRVGCGPPATATTA